MPQVGEFNRNRWTMFVADGARSGAMATSISLWTGKHISECRFKNYSKNLPRLVGGMIAIGMTKSEIQHRFNIDPDHSRQFWLEFLELPESEQVDTFRWADRLGKQARFRIGDL